MWSMESGFTHQTCLWRLCASLVTKELVIALNPKRNEWEEIKAGLDKIGYPNEL